MTIESRTVVRRHSNRRVPAQLADAKLLPLRALHFHDKRGKKLEDLPATFGADGSLRPWQAHSGAIGPHQERYAVDAARSGLLVFEDETPVDGQSAPPADLIGVHLPATFTVRSARGTLQHYYRRATKRVPIARVMSPWDAIDIVPSTAYIVGPNVTSSVGSSIARSVVVHDLPIAVLSEEQEVHLAAEVEEAAAMAHRVFVQLREAMRASKEDTNRVTSSRMNPWEQRYMLHVLTAIGKAGGPEGGRELYVRALAFAAGAKVRASASDAAIRRLSRKVQAGGWATEELDYMVRTPWKQGAAFARHVRTP